MRINNNIIAMNTHRQYTINTNSVAKSAEKLSSGYRINRAGDDAAGLAISEKMRAQIRGLRMASKNSSDAISLVQTAEGALQESHNILQRMREIAVQSASDTNETTIDRAALEAEFQQLIKEIDDTANKTRFNDQNLIDGSYATVRTSVTSTGTAAVKSSSTMAPGAYTPTLVANAGGAGSTAVPEVAAEGTISVTGIAGTDSDGSLTGAVTMTGYGDFEIGVTGGVSLQAAAKDASTTTLTLTVGTDTLTLDVANSAIVSGANTFTFTGTGGKSVTIDMDITPDTTDDDAHATLMAGLTAAKTATSDTTGEAAKPAVPAGAASVTMTVNGASTTLNIGDTSVSVGGLTYKFATALSATEIDGATTTALATLLGTATVVPEPSNPLYIQTGANEGDDLAINIDAMDSAALGIDLSSVATRAAASKAITEVNDALNKVSTQRAALGALQNRLNHKINNLDTSAENLSSAESRIRDLDMAQEMTNFTRNNILTQASTAMLAQANAAPQGVLQLLQ